MMMMMTELLWGCCFIRVRSASRFAIHFQTSFSCQNTSSSSSSWWLVVVMSVTPKKSVVLEAARRASLADIRKGGVARGKQLEESDAFELI